MATKATGNWKKTHDFRFFSGEDLGTKPVNLTVKEVMRDEIYDPNSKQKHVREIMYFEGTTKGIILNTNHHRAITQILGTDVYDEWEGKKLPWVGMPLPPHGLVCRLTNQYPNGKLKPQSR